MSIKSEAQDSSDARPAGLRELRRSRRRPWTRVLLATLMICLALGIGSLAGIVVMTAAVLKDQKAVLTPQMLLDSLFRGQLDHRVNLLLLGSDYNYAHGKRINDEQAGMRSRTDTIMLASLDPVEGKVSILSIPRDTYALLPGYHSDKINAAMAYGGVDLVKKTVSELTGVPIDYYMALKVDGLINTVDILGGIRMYVEKDMKYQDDTAHLGINIHKGWKERMNGEQAHGYIRFRSDELGDIGRVQRQQKFIHAVVDKLLQPASWLKLPALMQHLNENIETDMPQHLIGQLVKFGSGLKKEDLRMAMLPGTFDSSTGVSYWAMNPSLARKVIFEFFPDTTLAAAAETGPASSGSASARPYAQYHVTVWNATDDLQAGQEVVDRLKAAGWIVWSISKAPSGAPQTRFIAQAGNGQLLPELQSAVGYMRGEAIAASVGDIATDFTVLIEQDLADYLKRTRNRSKPSGTP